MPPRPLPPSFRSLYRVILRAASASTRHHPSATRRLRRSFRPLFDEAAQRINDAEWKKIWDARMDETLAFLYSSATSQGLAKSVTRNLTSMVYHRIDLEKPNPAKSKWHSNRPTEFYEIKPAKRSKRPTDRKHMIEENTMTAFEETLKMAEGVGGVFLGRYGKHER